MAIIISRGDKATSMIFVTDALAVCDDGMKNSERFSDINFFVHSIYGLIYRCVRRDSNRECYRLKKSEPLRAQCKLG